MFRLVTSCSEYTDYVVANVFRFLDLPRELRDAVCGYLVAPGKIHLCKKPGSGRLPHESQQSATPQWSLLVVSRQMRQEVAELMFLKNHVVLHHDLNDYGLLLGRQLPFIGQLHPKIPPEIALCHLARQHMRSMRISVDPRSIYPDDPIARAGEIHLMIQNRRTPGPRAHTELESVVLRHRLYGFGRELSDVLKCALDACKSLRFLQIDVANAYCVSGCCRNLALVADAFKHYAHWTKLETLEILGTKTQSERRYLTSALQSVQKRKGLNSINLVFRKFEPAGHNPALSAWNKHNRVALLHANGLEDLEEEQITIGGSEAQVQE